MEQITERRKSPRVALATLVDIQHGERFFYDYTVTCSEGGLFVETTQTLVVSDQVQIRFVLPKVDAVFEATAKVRWVNALGQNDKPNSMLKYQGVGVSFEKMSDEDRLELKNQLAKIST